MNDNLDVKETKKKLGHWFNTILAIGLVGFFILVFGLINNSTEKENMLKNQTPPNSNNSAEGVIIKTNLGSIEIDFYAEKAPKTVANFIKLAGSEFYNGTRFHRIVKDFMIQGGDPLSKDIQKKDLWGTGGPGYTFEDEIGENNKNDVGTIAMANAGPNTNGSQFFINTNNNNFLDTKHTVFGKVVNGMDVLAKINNVETEMNASGEKSLPVEDIIIESITLK